MSTEPFTAPEGEPVCPISGEPAESCEHVELDADIFRCIQCGAHRYRPAASSDDYSYEDGRYVAAGNPICEDCTRKGMEPAYRPYVSDGGPVECACCGEQKPTPIVDSAGLPICGDCQCPCCGQAPDCDCAIETVDSYSRETGPQSERGCFTHRRSV